MKKVYGPSGSSNAPLSSAWEVNGIVFVSGQIHADKNWDLIGVSIEERFTAAMKKIEGILSESGLTKNDIVHIRLYLTDVRELPALNEIYQDYFQHPFPARTALEVSSLPLGASLEIEAIAAK
jgi:2-iminobutanoate/2-iminopropanoate deaminase